MIRCRCSPRNGKRFAHDQALKGPRSRESSTTLLHLKENMPVTTTIWIANRKLKLKNHHHLYTTVSNLSLLSSGTGMLYFLF